MPRRASSDSGDTLIEILVAVTILGLTAVALLGAFASDLSGASIYKNTSTIETVLKNFAEDATYEIQYQSSSLFSPCAPLSGSATSGASTISYNGTTLAYRPPIGFTIAVTGIQYLSGNKTFGLCDITGQYAGQLEPQLITVKATVTGRLVPSGTLSFVVASFKYESYVPPA